MIIDKKKARSTMDGPSLSIRDINRCQNDRLRLAQAVGRVNNSFVSPHNMVV